MNFQSCTKSVPESRVLHAESRGRLAGNGLHRGGADPRDRVPCRAVTPGESVCDMHSDHPQTCRHQQTGLRSVTAAAV